MRHIQRQIHHIQLAQRYREYYYLTVNKNRYSIVNWVLIAMMVMLPMRSAMAFSQFTCEMHDESARKLMDHGMHMMVDGARMDIDAPMDCCLDSDNHCGNDCGMNMSVSIITPSAITLPALHQTAFRTHVINDLVFRDLAPPIRPPASL